MGFEQTIAQVLANAVGGGAEKLSEAEERKAKAEQEMEDYKRKLALRGQTTRAYTPTTLMKEYAAINGLTDDELLQRLRSGDDKSTAVKWRYGLLQHILTSRKQGEYSKASVEQRKLQEAITRARINNELEKAGQGPDRKPKSIDSESLLFENMSLPAPEGPPARTQPLLPLPAGEPGASLDADGDDLLSFILKRKRDPNELPWINQLLSPV